MTEDDHESRSDRELLADHVAGDSGAFGELFARHRQRLWAVALRTVGDPDEAADALQDALISAFRRAETYRGESAVTTWLHRIVVNACLDRLRRQKVRVAVPLPDDDAEYGDRGSTGTADPVDPSQEAERLLLRDAVAQALTELPFDQRAAIVLVDIEGHSVDEAAAILDCPAGTVKSRCARGRARLLPLLESWRERNQMDSPRVPSSTAEGGAPDG